MVLSEVKDKKEFKGLSDDLVSRVLVKCSEKYDVMDKKERKSMIKEARARLRELYSAFRIKGFERKGRILSVMKDWEDKELCEKIMQTHISTKERLDYYPELYNKIREHVNFRSVLDIGCGLNVFSMPWMGRVDYYGIEVNEDDVDFCNSYLEKFGLRGGIRWGDVLSFDKFLHTDVCFMFKVLDGFESLHRGFTEILLDKVSSKYVVVSFATKSLCGKKSISKKRLKWFRDIVENTIVEEFELGYEVYFILKR